LERVDPFYIRPRFEAASSDAASGAGREAECRYINLAGKRYRPALGIDMALAEIEKNRGTLYDEAVADACLRIFRDKGFQFEVLC